MKESAQARAEPGQGRSRIALGDRPGALREERHPRARAGGRDPEGRPERGRGAVHGAAVADDRAQGASQRRRDDRRDQPARARAAGRRHQGEGRSRAHRAGIRTVLLPARNRKDLEDIPGQRAARGRRSSGSSASRTRSRNAIGAARRGRTARGDRHLIVRIADGFRPTTIAR